ncbi:MAG: glycosyltransferase [Candidatus Helarchaeota archaeon]
MNNQKIDISIIILTKNAGNKFNTIINKIINQQLDMSFEIIVIDSGSTDNTIEIIKEKKSVKLYQIKPNKFHHSMTRNYGATLSKGKYLVYITQDATPLNNKWLKNIVLNIKKSNQIIYGRQIPYKDAIPSEKFFYKYYFPKHRILISKNKVSRTYKNTIFISDVNVAMTKMLWRKIQFSPKLNICEDKDFAYRAIKNGAVIKYTPKATVIHSHNLKLNESFIRNYYYGKIIKHLDKPIYLENNSENQLYRYIIELVKYLYRENNTKNIFYSIFYEILKILGLQMGKLSNLL